jgi:hypothetical protein
MKFYNRRQLLTLKAKIKGLAAEGKRTREILQTKSGYAKYYLWQIKREIGLETRLHLIAYGLLRGKRFSEIESNVKFPEKWPSDPSSLEYQLYANWNYNFPWEKLLKVIRNNCPSKFPDKGCVTVNGKTIYTKHKYWSIDNLKNLILKDKPLTDEELYDTRTLERLKAAS